MSRDLLERVRTRLGDRAAQATDPRVTVGERVVFVALSHPDHGPLTGLAHRPPNVEPGIWPSLVTDLAGLSTAETPLSRAVGIATLNALSVPDLDWQVGDPMAALSPAVDVVATIGLFRPAFEKFDDVAVSVVERDPPATVDGPPDVTVTTHAPSACDDAFADADVCFVTGSTLVYGGIDRYLDALSAAGVSPVVLVGATASHWPTPAFEAGVDLVAGARVDDPDRVRTRVTAGDCGTDLHDHGVAKVYVAARPDLPGVTLDRTSDRNTRTPSPRDTENTRS